MHWATNVGPRNPSSALLHSTLTQSKLLQDQQMTDLQPYDKGSLLSLPDEIVVYILAHVPGKDLISFQRASIQPSVAVKHNRIR